MSELTPAAALAWRIAAAEAGTGQHAQIERSHLLAGILSLEKVAGLPEAMGPADRASVLEEHGRLELRLARLGLDAASLRRALRKRMGRGKHPPDGQPISRSSACKEAFRRAEAAAGEGDVSALHLMVALLEEPDGVMEAVLDDAGVGVVILREQARAEMAGPAPPGATPRPKPAEAAGPLPEVDAARILRGNLADIADTLAKQHGVQLTVDPEAERFLARTGSGGAKGARELSATLEKLVQAPLRSLVVSGKIAKHTAWRIAYDEGGIYVVPA